jgi:hypothetical protein
MLPAGRHPRSEFTAATCNDRSGGNKAESLAAVVGVRHVAPEEMLAICIGCLNFEYWLKMALFLQVRATRIGFIPEAFGAIRRYQNVSN